MFTWLRKLWPFQWPWKSDEVPEPSHPIVLIPGICGSQLAVRKKDGSKENESGNRVWVCIEHADREYRQLWGRVNPSTELIELLDESQEVYIPTKDPKQASSAKEDGLYAVDVLDPSLYVPLHVVYYFHNLIWFLKKQKYEAAKTLFGFGYDFRQSNMSHMDALVKRLEEASAANNGVKVDVVTHSMGGLVMRSLLALRPDDYSRLVRKWIAIASPFGGAPGFGMDALMTGVQFCQGWEQHFFVSRRTMHAMCSQAPAVFELLPDPTRPDIWPIDRLPPKCTVYRRETASITAGAAEEEEDSLGGEAVQVDLHKGCSETDGVVKTEEFAIQDFRNVLKASMADFKVDTNDGQTVPLPMDDKCWEISDRARSAWRGLKVPPGSQFFNIFGTGFETAYDVSYGSRDAPLDALTDIADADPVRQFTWIDGDCTVPICCAVADGLDAVKRKGFLATHRGLLELPQVWETIMEFIDTPVTPNDVERSAHAFPESHALPASGASASAATSPGAGAAAAGQSGYATAREQRHAALRREAHARSKPLRDAWEQMARGGKENAAGVDAGWVMVQEGDAPRQRVARGDSGEVTVNPIHTHMANSGQA